MGCAIYRDVSKRCNDGSSGVPAAPHDSTEELAAEMDGVGTQRRFQRGREYEAGDKGGHDEQEREQFYKVQF